MNKENEMLWEYGFEADGSVVRVEKVELPKDIEKQFLRMFQEPINLTEIQFN
jgi:hypothetical protein